MFSPRFSGVAAALAAGVLAIAVSPAALADTTMTLCISDAAPTLATSACTTSDSVLINSNGTLAVETVTGSASITDSTSANELQAMGSVGIFDVSATGSIGLSGVQLAFDVSTPSDTTGTNSLWIQFNGYGFTGTEKLNIGGEISESAGVTDTLAGCVDPGGGPSTLFSGTASGYCGFPARFLFVIQSFPNAGPGTATFAGSTTAIGSATTSPYNLGVQTEATITGQGSTSGDFMAPSIPEPSSIVLLGSCLLALAGIARRKLHS